MKTYLSIKRRFSLQPLTTLILGALSLPVSAADGFGGLGFVAGGLYSVASGVSSDGNVAVGASSDFDTVEAFRWSNGTNIGLGFLPGGSHSRALGVSDDGGVVVGWSTGNNGVEAFRWTNNTMTGLGFLSGGNLSRAYGVSGDGSVVVGQGTSNDGMQALRWTTAPGANGGGTMTGLGFLPGGNFSSAQAASHDGSIVVGYSLNNGNEAFRWTTTPGPNGGGTMTSLGFLPGGNSSQAAGISADGSVVVGQSSSTEGTQAFRWTTVAGPNGGGTMTGLGFLPGGSQSFATAVSGDGLVVIGRADTQVQTPFRWTQSAGMLSIITWLARAGVTVPAGWALLEANGVNQDGTVIVGDAMDPNGNQQAWLARATAVSSGLLTDIPAFNNTLAEAGSRAIQSSAGMANLSLFGAHHRSLLDNGLVRTDANAGCAWGTADTARHNQTETRMELAEVGVCKDIGNTRLGLGIGQAWAHQEMSQGGSIRQDGQYLLLEADHAYANGLQPSITGYFGRFSSKIQRHYMNGATVDSSDANPDNQSFALRLRLDWKNAAQFAGFSLTPYTAYTHLETKLDAYTETGGGFPAQFAAAKWKTSDFRIGSAATMKISGATDLRLGLEAAHRFENNTSGVNGEVVGLWSFSLPGQKVTQTWGRATIDIDHRLSNSLALTLGSNIASSGGDASWGVTAGVRASF